MKYLTNKRKVQILRIKAWVNNLFKKEKYTHFFFYSDKQKCVVDSIQLFNGEQRQVVKFKGRPYTEMRQFKYGFPNWNDAVLLGIGSYRDINN